jgi:hypothetical protein
MQRNRKKKTAKRVAAGKTWVKKTPKLPNSHNLNYNNSSNKKKRTSRKSLKVWRRPNSINFRRLKRSTQTRTKRRETWDFSYSGPRRSRDWISRYRRFRINRWRLVVKVMLSVVFKDRSSRRAVTRKKSSLRMISLRRSRKRKKLQMRSKHRTPMRKR